MSLLTLLPLVSTAVDGRDKELTGKFALVFQY